MSRGARTLNYKLVAKYERERKETQEKVEEAILILKEEGGIINISNLAKVAGLSIPVFCKSHVKEILKKYEVCGFKQTKVVPQEDEKSYLKRLEKDVSKLSRQNENFSNIISKEREKIMGLERELAEKTTRIQLLLGTIDKLQSKFIDLGYDIDKVLRE